MSLPWPALALAAFAVLAPSAAFADPAKVSDLVDDLQRIQLKIAQGDKAAYPAQLNQLKTIGAAIAAVSPETWKDKREADSLVIYILSGGSLADVAPLLKGDAIVESERSLARGALAYVTNHEADAIGLLRANESDRARRASRGRGRVRPLRSRDEARREGGGRASRLGASACAGRIGRGSRAPARDRSPRGGQGRGPRGDVDSAICDPLRRLALCGGFLARSRGRRRAARSRRRSRQLQAPVERGGGVAARRPAGLPAHPGQIRARQRAIRRRRSRRDRGSRKLEGRQPGGHARPPLSRGQSALLGRVRRGGRRFAGSVRVKARPGRRQFAGRGSTGGGGVADRSRARRRQYAGPRRAQRRRQG